MTIKQLPSSGLRPGSIHAEWRERSACSKAIEENPGVARAFTDDTRQGYFTVKRICRKCEVKMSCLMDALSDIHSEGYRNALYFMDGRLSAADNRILQDQYGVRAKPRQKAREKQLVGDQDL